MSRDAPIQRRSYDHLSALADELVRIEELLRKIGSRHTEVTIVLDEVSGYMADLCNRTSRLQSVVKEAATLAIAEDHEDRERLETLEEEKRTLERSLAESQGALEAKEACIKELQEKLDAAVGDLQQQVLRRESLLQIRDAVLKNLESAMGTLNRLDQELASKSEAIIPLETVSEGPPEEEGDASAPPLGAPSERRRAEARAKEILEAKEALEERIFADEPPPDLLPRQAPSSEKARRKRGRFIFFLG
jgi:DNA repair exonuclease SbcCD ATPase subunit